jgi:hypothetical protein
MVTETIPQLKTLSAARKRRLIEELIAEAYGEPVKEPKLENALRRRLAHARRNPGTIKSWAEVKAGLRNAK